MIVTIEQIRAQAKNDLEGYQSARKQMGFYERRIEEINAQSLRASSTLQRIKVTDNYWTAERVADQKKEFADTYGEWYIETENEAKRIESNIRKIYPPFCDVLRTLYLENFKFDIHNLRREKEFRYSDRQLYRIHNKALELYFIIKNNLDLNKIIKKKQSKEKMSQDVTKKSLQ